MKSICPHCEYEYNLMSSLLGTNVKCEKCGNRYTVKKTKKCPFCAEIIKTEAAVCRFCKMDLRKTDNRISSERKSTLNTYSSISARRPEKRVQPRPIPQSLPQKQDDFKCPECNRRFTIKNISDARGDDYPCPFCGYPVYIPLPEPVQIYESQNMTPARQTDGYLTPGTTSSLSSQNRAIVKETGYIDNNERILNVLGLYTPAQVALATFIGNALGGGILIILNFKRMGQENQIAKAMVVIIAGFLIFIFSTSFWTSTLWVNSILQAAVMYKLAEKWQGHAIDIYHSNGGKTASTWGATGAGLLGVVVAFILIIIVLVIIGASMN